MNAPRTRVEALRLAARYLDLVDARLKKSGRGAVRLGSGSITVLEAARRHIEPVIADFLESLPSRKGRDLAKNVVAWTEQRAYDVKERARDQLWAARGWGKFPSSSARGLRVLALPRTKNHVRDQSLLAEHNARSGELDFTFIAFDPATARDLRTRGHRVVLGGAYAHARIAEEVRLRFELSVERFAWREEVPAEICDVIHRAAQTQISSMLASADAIVRAIDELDPHLVLAGNPCTTEGAIGVAAAHARGKKAAAMQHGDFGPAHVEWARSPVDLITTWGRGPRDVLVGLGVRPEKIAICGAPWVDRLSPRARARNAKRRALVATSGAGHTVGLPEHTAHVRRLLEASAELADECDFVFRLHPKDKPALYEQLLAEIPGARAELVEARRSGPIHEELPRFDLLITVTSTSAIDAMLHDIPVITLARPAGEIPPAFVSAGATVEARPHESLAARIREDADPEVLARARAYVETFFGAKDGRAAERVTCALLGLAGQRIGFSNTADAPVDSTSPTRVFPS